MMGNPIDFYDDEDAVLALGAALDTVKELTQERARRHENYGRLSYGQQEDLEFAVLRVRAAVRYLNSEVPAL